MSYYAWILLASLAGPLALSFDSKVAYYKLLPKLMVAFLVNAAFFLVWDSWFAFKQIWGFNTKYVWPVRIAFLPIEEVLFFFVVPYASVFIYVCIKYYFSNTFLKSIAHAITLFFFFITLTLAVFNSNKSYTFYNCFIASVLLAIQYLFFKSSWMHYFWTAFFIHLVPFFIINGLLTGAATSEPVVWYNPQHILGIRIVTIPVEDVFYSLSCLLIPVSVYEFINEYKKNSR